MKRSNEQALRGNKLISLARHSRAGGNPEPTLKRNRFLFSQE
jgi:hypothetical protein